ncbi:MAG: C-terminal binding protein [Anaerolineae bacterium]|nr:C-terminal binding protein [Anaerolineae bacterium]
MTIICTDDSSDGLIERDIVEAAGKSFAFRPCRTPEELVEASREAEALLVGLLPVPGDLLRQRPQLKLIVTCSTGWDHIDIAAATELGILVCNAGDYCADEVADHTMLLILAAWRNLTRLAAEVRQGGWNFDCAGAPRPLQGTVLGLIGMGRIGSRVAQRAKAFGLRVLGYDPFIPPEQIQARGVEPVSLAGLLAQADIISLHLPSQAGRQPILTQAAFAQMKPGALLVNVSRADLVDTPAARAALESGQLSGLAFDVWETEPPVTPDPLFNHPQVLITPHAAWYSTASVRALHQRTAEEAVRILSGEPPRFAVNHPHPSRLKIEDSR